ncbi:MAG: hypothetical protein ACI4PG_08745 [Candidatus Ventricola sp.]
MLKRLWALALASIIGFVYVPGACAATLGPAASYEALCELLASAQDGDVILISGELSADGQPPLASAASVRISSADGQSAAIRGLRLRDASIAFDHIHLTDTLSIDGQSNILLGNAVTVSGGDAQSGVSFSGSGTLIVERGCIVEGGREGDGIAIRHSGGDFYGSIEGTVSGGSGSIGGTGVVISPLSEAGAVMITGSIQGGKGTSLGGHALNLYDLSGNAFVTVDGTLQGGEGSVGGDGIQLISADDNVNVGISGAVKGGAGEAFGGAALILMNAGGSASFHLTGSFSGGDALDSSAQPGASLQLVGDSATARTRIGDCILEDGRPFAGEPSPELAVMPVITPLPEITSSIEDVDPLVTPTPAPSDVPEPTPEAPADTPAPTETPVPTETPAPAETPAETPVPANEPEPIASAELSGTLPSAQSDAQAPVPTAFSMLDTGTPDVPSSPAPGNTAAPLS